MPRGVYKRTEKHKNILSLAHKGLITWMKGRSHTEEAKKKISEATSSSKSVHWKGGRRFNSQGYVLVWKKDHPSCNNEGYVRAHRLVMEKHLSRYLEPKEVVHHIDHNKLNNNLGNLHLFSSNGEHKKYHDFLQSCVKEALSN